MADWVFGAEDVFGYEFSGLNLDEAAQRAPLVVRAAWTGGFAFVVLYHGAIPSAGRWATDTGPNEPLRRALVAQQSHGDWRTWSFTKSKRHRTTEAAITIALRPNPRPSWLALPNFNESDYMEETG